MGASDSSGLPDFTDDRIRRDLLPEGHVNVRQMAVHTDQPLAMIDHDRLAVKKVVTHGCNSPGSDTFNGCSLWSRNIKPAVGAPRLPVEHSALTKAG